MVHDPPALASAETDQERRRILLARSADARSALAGDYFAHARALRAPGAALGAWAALATPGRDAATPVSRYELMELLASRRFENPGWFVDLQAMSQENLLRELVILQAVSLMLDWRRYRLDERRGAIDATGLALAAERMRLLPGLANPSRGDELTVMGALRFLFVPELTRSLNDAARSSAGLVQRMRPFRLPVPANAPPNATPGTRKENRLWLTKKRALSCIGLLVLLAGTAFIGLGIAGLLLAEPAAAQTIDRGLFADADRATRDVLAFLGDISAGRSSVLGDMLFVFNGGVLALAGFLLVWHTVAGTLDTAREGRFGFGAWEIVRIVAAVALMAPLPGGMNGAQHAVIGLAHLGGDFANAVWEPFSEEALGEGEPIAPRPREAVWRAAIARTLILETCRYAANGSAARAGDAPYIELRETGEAYKSPGTVRVRRIGARILHYDGAGRGMPGDLCGAIRFAGLAAEGARGIAAEGHRDALAGLLRRSAPSRPISPPITWTGSLVYGRPLPDLDALLEGRGLAERYAGVLDTALARAASEERAELARVVAEDAKAASWMSAASFFNTIPHRTGLFQAAAHNIPDVSLPPPSLGQWAPAADAAVKGLTTALVQSRGYQPMLFSAAAGGRCRIARAGRWRRHGGGSHGVHRPRQRHRRRQRQSHC